MILDMLDYPRTMTRGQWRQRWAARRRTNRMLRQSQADAVKALSMDLPPSVKADVADKLVNPPIFAWPNP